MAAYDPRAILEELLQERREIDAAIVHFQRKAALSVKPLRGPLGSSKHGSSEEDPKLGRFASMSTPDAARAYLAERSVPLKPAEIKQGLLEGGIRSTSKNFYSTLYTTLSRLERAGDIVKGNNGSFVLKTWRHTPA